MPSRLGKASPQVMREIQRLTGATSQNVIEGPRAGLDNSIVRLRDEIMMVSSTDPLSFIPSLGPARSAWLSVHGIASDVSSSGLPPRYALFDLNLPPAMSDGTLRAYWRSIHQSCKELGIAIIGGHTGRFEGCNYTIVGGGVMMAIGSQDMIVTPKMAEDKDDLVLTKTAALEATAVLANSFPATIRKRLGDRILSQARKLIDSVSTVNEARVAALVGVHENGVTAMHDVTEGGVVSAILDVAKASGLKANVDQESIPVYESVRQICQLFRIDPLTSLGQGCLVIAVRPSKTERLLHELRKAMIPAARVGRLMRRTGPSIIQGRHKTVRLSYPSRDPYWRAYWRAARQNLA